MKQAEGLKRNTPLRKHWNDGFYPMKFLRGVFLHTYHASNDIRGAEPWAFLHG